jgi:prophage regulatory protein
MTCQLPNLTIEFKTRMLRRKEVEALVGLSRSAIYDALKRNAFPKPTRVGRRAVRWDYAEIRSWLAERATKAHSDE